MKKTMRYISLMLLFVLIISSVPTGAADKYFYNPNINRYLTFEDRSQYIVQVWDRSKPMTSTAGDHQIGQDIDTRVIEYAGQKAVVTAQAYMDCFNACKYIDSCVAFTITGSVPLVAACALATGTYCGAQCTSSVMKIWQ